MKAALHLIMGGGRVKRYHAKTTLQEETVAAHSYVVAWLVTLGSNYAPRAELVLAALQHDIAEVELGDMPGPAKLKLGLSGAFAAAESALFRSANMPDFDAALTPQERTLLKLADNLSGWLTCEYEAQMGNKTLRQTQRTYRSYIDKQLAAAPELADFAMAIMLAAELGAEE